MTVPIDTPILVLILLVTLIVVVIWIVRLEMRLHRLTRGKTGGDLEGTIIAHGKALTDFEEFQREMEKYLQGVERRLRRSIQGIKTVRFNPFKGTGEGGFQSFASAFVNEDGDGLVISTLWSRDRMSIFGKPLTKGTSSFDLTEEEKNAIGEAQSSIGSK